MGNNQHNLFSVNFVRPVFPPLWRMALVAVSNRERLDAFHAPRGGHATRLPLVFGGHATRLPLVLASYSEPLRSAVVSHVPI